MKKVSIIYWSCGGNIEVLANIMANSIREEGAEVNIKHVADATMEDVLYADAVAFGSPAANSTSIEQGEMQPFIDKLNDFKKDNKGKKCILFATYGWIENKFMDRWENQIIDSGFDLIANLAVKESPNKKQVEEARRLAILLAK